MWSVTSFRITLIFDQSEEEIKTLLLLSAYKVCIKTKMLFKSNFETFFSSFGGIYSLYKKLYVVESAQEMRVQ